MSTIFKTNLFYQKALDTFIKYFTLLLFFSFLAIAGFIEEVDWC